MMRMRSSCNLELQLLPPSSSDSCLPLPSSQYTTGSSYQQLGVYNNIPKQEAQQKQKQKQKELTIFYNGKMVSCDATEFQARAIILLAKRENEEISKKSNYSSLIQSQISQQQLYGAGPGAGAGAGAGLSMKKSLQQFLHKRKTRIQAAANSPYYHH